MKTIKNVAASLFIIAVVILSAISILGVWKIFSNDVIVKSFETLGLLAVVSAITMVAGKFIEAKNQTAETVPEVPSPAFKAIRQSTLVVLIVSGSILALLGVLSIWDVITNKDVLYKSLGSLAILAFSSLIIVATCLEMEGFRNSGEKGRNISGGNIIAGLFLFFILFMLFRGLIFRF